MDPRVVTFTVFFSPKLKFPVYPHRLLGQVLANKYLFGVVLQFLVAYWLCYLLVGL